MCWKPLALIMLGVVSSLGAVTGASAASPLTDYPPPPAPTSVAAVLDVADPLTAHLALAPLDWTQRGRTVIDPVVPVDLTGDAPQPDVQHAVLPVERLRSPLDHLSGEGW